MSTTTDRARRRLAIVGPTAAGKSAVAVAVAVEVGGEIITADSMQVYRGMDIGTATPPPGERAGVPHHLVDVAEPSEEFSVARYQAEATSITAAIEARGQVPVLAGGTGLYVQAVVDELDIPGQYPSVRAALDAVADTAELYRWLTALDPVAAGRMEPSNRRRVVRAVEVVLGSGRRFSSFGPGIEAYPATTWHLAGIDAPVDVLDRRIEQRVHAMIAGGLVDEVERLLALDAGLSRTARQALGYKEVIDHLDGRASLDEAVDLVIRRTRRFARRQRGWFRRDPRVRWYVVENPLDAVPALLGDWGRS